MPRHPTDASSTRGQPLETENRPHPGGRDTLAVRRLPEEGGCQTPFRRPTAAAILLAAGIRRRSTVHRARPPPTPRASRLEDRGKACLSPPDEKSGQPHTARSGE